ncbi:alpha/beta hydrolase [Bdellovibrio sp. SKB1291214]|uniref:alpha/beta hydrolase n=1 Tax=Bdellovibrio sp. SKB1291214 TaxID=1732569 RepID=UPI001595BB66|nr:alpha/beta hydrolase [Bdellovibrio sp. SKB1291214]UYL10294.1 alpha/beta hydrolase [Bdellovibrio sp. SKB1291214]
MEIAKFDVSYIVIAIVRVVVLAYLGLTILAYMFQEKIIFYPSVLPSNHKFNFNSKFEEHVSKVDSDEIHSLIFHAPDSKGIILYFHGNAGALDGWGEVAQEISMKTSMDVWIVDYPGYGKSTGKISSQEQLLKIGTQILKELKDRNTGKNIFIYGRSIGSGLATYLGSDSAVKGLVLETPYLSLTELANNTAPFLPSFILKYPMPSNEWITQVKCPILIIHGNQDEVIPFSQGLALSKIRDDVRLVEIDRGNHNDLDSYPLYWESLTNFFKSIEGVN